MRTFYSFCTLIKHCEQKIISFCNPYKHYVFDCVIFEIQNFFRIIVVILDINTIFVRISQVN